MSAIPLSSIVSGTPGGDTILYPPMTMPLFAGTLDRMEYLMGFNRGDLDQMQASEDPLISFEMSEDLREGCAMSWAIVPEQIELLEQVERLFRKNQLAPVEEREDIRHIMPPTTYTYRFFSKDELSFHTRDGEPVVSGQTLVTSSIHPCICPLLYTAATVKLMRKSDFSILTRLSRVINVEPLPMTFVEQKQLPNRELPVAWIDPASQASEIFKNKPMEGSSLPKGFRNLLKIAKIDVQKWDYKGYQWA